MKTPLVTKKYKVYINGDIYLLSDNKKIGKIYDESNLEYLTAISKKEADELIEMGEGAIEASRAASIRGQIGIPDSGESLCSHKYIFLGPVINGSINNNGYTPVQYGMCCTYCLNKKIVSF